LTRAHRHLGQREPHVPTLPERRPAETATLVTGALVGLGAKVWGWDVDVVAYLTVLVGAVPAGITWCVERWRAR
jgi:phage shock protein PspC (stress-responsive transcriptional regulator)